MLVIFNKEFKSYFKSASAYIFMGVMLLFSGLFFVTQNVFVQNTYFNGVIGAMSFVFLLAVPVITMKIFSEEVKTRTDQLLLTCPQTVTNIVLGKYFAAVALLLVTLLITALYPLMLSLFGKVSGPEIFTAYVGFFMMGACIIAIGIFISSLTDNVVVSAVGTLGAILFIWLLDWVKQILPSSRNSGIVFAVLIALAIAAIVYFSTKNLFASGATAVVGLTVVAVIYIVKKEVFERFITNVFGWFSLLERNQTFTMGILSLESVLYFLSFAFIFVFLTIRMIEKRRWS